MSTFKVDSQCKRLIVGLDFGTACSGAALVLSADPESVSVCAPGLREGCGTKVPTALLHVDNTWKFGIEAEVEYNNIINGLNPGDELPCKLYRNFKMILKGKDQDINSIFARSDCGGETWPLIDLVVIVLRKLKDFAMKKNDLGFGNGLQLEDIQWVITVPAIWNDFGKAFMREAALRAELITEVGSSSLMLALEPEAAALAVHICQTKHNFLSIDKRFMTLDCGGGTVDITVHEVVAMEPHLRLKAVDIPSGGAWGGKFVNEKFEEFLGDLLGEQLYADYQGQSNPSTQEIRAAFDSAKLVCEPDAVPLAFRMLDILPGRKSLKGLAEAYNARHPEKPILITPALINNDYLSMSSALMLSFFEPLLLEIVEAVRASLARVQDVKAIILVGGFGSSKVVIDRIRKEFHSTEPEGLKVISPDPSPEPQAAIVHGAVYFGLYKNIIDSRLSPYTYGIAMRMNGVHNRFKVMVHRGQELPTGHSVDVIGGPDRAEQTSLSWRLFRSDEVFPVSVTDKTGNVTKIGVVTLECPAHRDKAQRMQTIHFMFGGAEILVTATNSLNQTKPLKIEESALSAQAAAATGGVRPMTEPAPPPPPGAAGATAGAGQQA